MKRKQTKKTKMKVETKSMRVVKAVEKKLGRQRIVKQVYQSKSNGQKNVTIPANCDISDGDFVEIIKLVK